VINEQYYQTRKTSIHRVLKFLVTGGFAASIEYFSFFAFIHFFDQQIIISNITSFMLGFITSFLLNKQWVFKSKGDIRRQLAIYLSLALLNLTISTFLIWFLNNNLLINALIAKLVVMVVIATWNYFLFSKIIFIDRSKKTDNTV
jgi:putative flippase GtrA